MDLRTETKLLQVTVGIGCLVPIGAGLAGIIFGAGMLGGGGMLDSHYRYLSGLLLGIGLGFVSLIPGVEKQGAKVTLLSAIVIVGGLARLYGVLVEGWPEAPMAFALVMELGVVPMLWLWQRRVARRANSTTF